MGAYDPIRPAGYTICDYPAATIIGGGFSLRTVIRKSGMQDGRTTPRLQSFGSGLRWDKVRQTILMSRGFRKDFFKGQQSNPLNSFYSQDGLSPDKPFLFFCNSSPAALLESIPEVSTIFCFEARFHRGGKQRFMSCSCPRTWWIANAGVPDHLKSQKPG